MLSISFVMQWKWVITLISHDYNIPVKYEAEISDGIFGTRSLYANQNSQIFDRNATLQPLKLCNWRIKPARQSLFLLHNKVRLHPTNGKNDVKPELHSCYILSVHPWFVAIIFWVIRTIERNTDQDFSSYADIEAAAKIKPESFFVDELKKWVECL